MNIASQLNAGTPHDKLVKATRVWVAQTFYGQMLKQMHNSPIKSEDWVTGGRGGEAFQGQLDQQLAQRMAGGHSGDRLVNSIVKRIEGGGHGSASHSA